MLLKTRLRDSGEGGGEEVVKYSIYYQIHSVSYPQYYMYRLFKNKIPFRLCNIGDATFITKKKQDCSTTD